jgi:hypothetical protein
METFDVSIRIFTRLLAEPRLTRCGREDLNLQGFPHMVLNQARLPFRHVREFSSSAFPPAIETIIQKQKGNIYMRIITNASEFCYEFTNQRILIRDICRFVAKFVEAICGNLHFKQKKSLRKCFGHMPKDLSSIITLNYGAVKGVN